jgi:hypothetical protein
MRLAFYLWVLPGLLGGAAACGDDSASPGGGGQGGQGGQTASATGSGQSAQQSGSGSTTSTGGQGGAGGGELCAERTDGALIDFAIVGETLRVWVTGDAFIDEAIAQLEGSTPPRVPVFDLLDGQDCDPQWTWHPPPMSPSFADATIELCDGLPSHIEMDKPYWLDTVGQFCPWSAMVTAVEDRRP